MVYTNLVIVIQTELFGSGWTENLQTIPRGLCKETEKPNIFIYAKKSDWTKNFSSVVLILLWCRRRCVLFLAQVCKHHFPWFVQSLLSHLVNLCKQTCRHVVGPTCCYMLRSREDRTLVLINSSACWNVPPLMMKTQNGRIFHKADLLLMQIFYRY